ncbi:hypothetical protein DFAR_2210067 [Desulfarculales bacterium]
MTAIISEMMRRHLAALDMSLQAPTVYRFLHQCGRSPKGLG